MVKVTQAVRHAKGFTCWGQFVAMLFCQLGRAHSLREITGGLRSCEGRLTHLGITAPSHSTPAYANEHRPWDLYQQVFLQLLERCRVQRYRPESWISERPEEENHPRAKFRESPGGNCHYKTRVASRPLSASALCSLSTNHPCLIRHDQTVALRCNRAGSTMESLRTPGLVGWDRFSLFQ